MTRGAKWPLLRVSKCGPQSDGRTTHELVRKADSRAAPQTQHRKPCRSPVVCTVTRPPGESGHAQVGEPGRGKAKDVALLCLLVCGGRTEDSGHVVGEIKPYGQNESSLQRLWEAP